MKRIQLLVFFLMLLLTSCEKKEETLNTITANSLGFELFSDCKAQAYKYEDFKDYKKVRYEYQIIGNGSETLKICFVDSTLMQNEFQYPELSVILFQKTDDSTSSSYTGYAGKLLIVKQSSDHISGEFTLMLRNDKDATDTLIVNDGRFELALFNARRDF